jgi:hypothetical protein
MCLAYYKVLLFRGVLGRTASPEKSMQSRIGVHGRCRKLGCSGCPFVTDGGLSLARFLR